MKRSICTLFVLVHLPAVHAMAADTGVVVLHTPELTRFEKQFDESMNQADVARIKALFDANSYSQKVMAGFTASPPVMLALSDSARANPPTRSRFSDIAQSGSYHVVHVIQRNGKPYLLCRLVTDDGVLLYDAWQLEKNSDGQQVATDRFDAASGEFHSSGIHRTYAYSLSETAKDWLKYATKADQELVVIAGATARITAAMREKKFAEVENICNSLPKSLQKDKPLLVKKVLALSQLGAPASGRYNSAEKEYRDLYGDDVALDLLMFRMWQVQGNFDQCDESLDRLERWIGGDPYLQSVRAEIVLLRKKADTLQEAERLLRAAIAGEARVPQTWAVLLKVLIEQKKYGPAAEAYQTYEKITGIVISKEALVQQLPGAAEFFASEAFKNRSAGKLP